MGPISKIKITIYNSPTAASQLVGILKLTEKNNLTFKDSFAKFFCLTLKLKFT